jgi:hypothetical protein
MKIIAVAFGLILLLTASVNADEYLTPRCQSILNNDLVNNIEVADVDRDGIPNVMAGTSVNGLLYNYVYKGADCSVEWTALASGGWSFNTKGDVKSWTIADMNGDGRNQVVINSVKSSHPKSSVPTEYLWVIHETSLEDWNFDKECGLTHAVDVADVSGDGDKDIIVGTHSKKVCAVRYDPPGRDYIHWKYDTKHPVHYVNALDVDDDGKVETVALASKYMDAQLIMLSDTGKLLWEKNIADGVYTAMLESNLIDVADLDADGKSEVIVGTYKKGILVYGSRGAVKWSYETGKPVTSILATDLDGDGRMEVLAGSAPNVIALDYKGSLKAKWTAPVDNTIYSMSAYDIDGDGKKEVAVGKTKYIRVLDDDFTLKGSWKYTVEIQGLTKAYEERDANAVAVYMGDLDADGDAEVAAAWNWEQSTIRGNEYSADLRVYEINKDYRPEVPTTTTVTVADKPTETTVTTQTTTSTTMRKPTVEPYYEEEEDEGGLPCLPLLSAVFALGLALAAKIPLAMVKLR